MSTYTKACTGGANDNALGDVAWTNPGNILASDNARATSVITAPQETQYLKAAWASTTFAIPTRYRVAMIRVDVERSKAGGATLTAADTEARLFPTGGSLTAYANFAASVAMPSTEAVQSYSLPNTGAYSGGTRITPANLNAGDVSFTVRYVATANNPTAQVDQVQMIVTAFPKAAPRSRTRARCR